ncbi:WD40 repeat-like protein [Tilletiaria anomala UBC 951]|uniref:WD40 repeat-like protein n=1 Tax=Tilletiaria anomala (strain ATCC 24038 / CBS 436.72 / UBC 951) TaxID=1037660 RepID=A0A066WN31_TILAU|nr:WD40 repeat-like protein [Tilletiaria anomala UBC 951]KDN52379.1 WD40 repeat-like protein [Tilletiaria anomala UBC 951]
MAGTAQKRKQPPGSSGTKATVFRKSAKKARQDANSSSSKRYEDEEEAGRSKGKGQVKKSETSGAAKRAAAKAKAAEEAKPKKPAVKLPNSYTDVRAKSKAPQAGSYNKGKGKVTESAGKPKTKHDFIQKKKAQAAAATAAAKKCASQAEQNKSKQKAKDSQKRTASHEDIPALVPTPPPATSTLRIVAGSYERLLYGLDASVTAGTEGLQFTFTPHFIFPAHISSIRSVACAGHDSKWLATGGTDESIKVWDLRKRIEVGTLTGHEGTITALHFPTRTYLLTTGQDGRINIYRSRDWSLLKTLKGHVGSVNDVAAHPSGRVALSVGKDRTIRMWDLMRGVGAASTKIGEEGERVTWDSHGNRFAVLAGPHLRVHDTQMKVLGEITAKVRWHDVRFYSVKARELMFVAGEDKMVHVYDVAEPFEVEGIPTFKEIARLVGHNNRVRTVCVQPVKPSGTNSNEAKDTLAAVTISSDGLIRAFDLSPLVAAVGSSRADETASPLELPSAASYDTKGSRLTCLSVAGVLGAPSASTSGVSKASSGDQADEEDNDEKDEDSAEEVDLVDTDEFVLEGASEDDEEPDTDAEEEELRELQKQIDEAKAAGMLEDDTDESGDEDASGHDDDDTDDDVASLEAEGENESEPEDA